MAERLLRAGILTKRNTIRLAPPFVIERTEIDWAIERIAAVLDEVFQEIVEPLAAG